MNALANKKPLKDEEGSRLKPELSEEVIVKSLDWLKRRGVSVLVVGDYEIPLFEEGAEEAFREILEISRSSRGASPRGSCRGRCRATRLE